MSGILAVSGLLVPFSVGYEMGIMETDFFLTSRMDVSLSKFYQIFLPSL